MNWPTTTPDRDQVECVAGDSAGVAIYCLKGYNAMDDGVWETVASFISKGRSGMWLVRGTLRPPFYSWPVWAVIPSVDAAR